MKPALLKIIGIVVLVGGLSLRVSAQNILPDSVREIIPDTGIITSEDTVHIPWRIYKQYSNAHFNRDIAPGGGAWSLQFIDCKKGKQDYAGYYFSGIGGTNTFKLNYWCKILNKTKYVVNNGNVRVGVVDKNNILAQRQVSNVPNKDIFWTQHFMTFKLTTKATDTIGVRLFGGGVKDSASDSVQNGMVLFDKVHLTMVVRRQHHYHFADSTLVPDGDLEQWTNRGRDDLVCWHDNACPMCVPACSRDVFRKDSTNVFHGKYSAKMIARGCSPSETWIKFPLTKHPAALTVYIKKHDITDTATISITLYYNGKVVDEGRLTNNESLDEFTEMVVPISQHAAQIDSAEIRVKFGNERFHGYHTTHYTEVPQMWIDYFMLRE